MIAFDFQPYEYRFLFLIDENNNPKLKKQIINNIIKLFVNTTEQHLVFKFSSPRFIFTGCLTLYVIRMHTADHKGVKKTEI